MKLLKFITAQLSMISMLLSPLSSSMSLMTTSSAVTLTLIPMTSYALTIDQCARDNTGTCTADDGTIVTDDTQDCVGIPASQCVMRGPYLAANPCENNELLYFGHPTEADSCKPRLLGCGNNYTSNGRGCEYTGGGGGSTCGAGEIPHNGGGPLDGQCFTTCQTDYTEGLTFGGPPVDCNYNPTTTCNAPDYPLNTGPLAGTCLGPTDACPTGYFPGGPSGECMEGGANCATGQTLHVQGPNDGLCNAGCLTGVTGGIYSMQRGSCLFIPDGQVDWLYQMSGGGPLSGQRLTNVPCEQSTFPEGFYVASGAATQSGPRMFQICQWQPAVICPVGQLFHNGGPNGGACVAGAGCEVGYGGGNYVPSSTANQCDWVADTGGPTGQTTIDYRGGPLNGSSSSTVNTCDMTGSNGGPPGIYVFKTEAGSGLNYCQWTEATVGGPGGQCNTPPNTLFIEGVGCVNPNENGGGGTNGVSVTCRDGYIVNETGDACIQADDGQVVDTGTNEGGPDEGSGVADNNDESNTSQCVDGTADSSSCTDGGTDTAGTDNSDDDNVIDEDESRAEYAKDQLAANQEYQSNDDGSSFYMSDASCAQTGGEGVDERVLSGALEENRLAREQNLLDKFGECLFNDMAEANVLQQRTQELNTTLGPIGSFSGFGDVNGSSFDPQAYDNLRRERDQLINEVQSLTRSNRNCAPTTATQPDYCNGRTGRYDTNTLPAGCENKTAHEQIREKQRRLDMIEGDLLALEEKKNASGTIASGDRNISSDNRNNLNNGADSLDSMEMWEESKDRQRRAEAALPIAEAAYNAAFNSCYMDNVDRFRNAECYNEVQEKQRLLREAQAEVQAAIAAVRMYFNQMRSRSNSEEGAASEASSRDGGAKAGATLNSINANAGAYGPFLDKISNVVARSEGLYNDAMAQLDAATNDLENREQFTDDYETYELMSLDLNDQGAQSTRDIQLLISDLGLMATASSGAQTMRCREIGYNKDTRQIDFRPGCPTSGAGTPLPKDLNARVGNPNATFKQCYVRSYSLFRAASAMYLAAEINAKENMNRVANECLMRCIDIRNTAELERWGIDPERREPNCMVRADRNNPSSTVPGIFVSGNNSQDDKNEQLAALERAANLYGNMVTMADLKSSNKDQALNMYNVAYQAAMEEMSAKTMRVSTAQANLDAARAALKATNTAIMLILAAIAAYTAYKTAMEASCSGLNPFACAEAARMWVAIIAAVAYMNKMQKQKQKAQKEVAYWMEELKDAQLHGHMACNYPGIGRNYQVLSDTSLIRDPGSSQIGIARSGTGGTNLTLGDAELAGVPTPVFDGNGNCINYCQQGAVYIPPEADLYDAIQGDPDLEWAVSREETTQNNIAQFVDGECIRYCGNLDAAQPDLETFNEDARNGNQTSVPSQPSKPGLPSLLEKMNSSEVYAEKFDAEFMHKQIERFGVLEFLSMILPNEAKASNVSIIDNNSMVRSVDDSELGRTLGMQGLNNNTDFNYFLAMKIEALKMQTLDNTTTVNLQANPVTVDHLVEWNGSDCNASHYNTNMPDPGSGAASNGIPTTNDINNRHQTVGCGVEMHLEDFADTNERNKGSFLPLPYKEELPEKTGFPLPETRHVYVMSVVRQIQKNMMLHSYRKGDCFTAQSTNTDGRNAGAMLAAAGGTKDQAPTTICGMANRYAQLVRYARRQLNLGDIGLDEVATDLQVKTNGVCMKSSALGNPIPDPVCECRMNDNCAVFKNPQFGNFSTEVNSAGALATEAANATLEGDLTGANVAAGQLSTQSNAIRRSLRNTKEKLADALFGDDKKKKAEFIKKNPSLDPKKNPVVIGSGGKLKIPTNKRKKFGRFGDGNDEGEAPDENGETSEDGKTAGKDGKKGKKDAAAKTAEARKKRKGKTSFYAGSDVDLDLDDMNFDDEGINIKGGNLNLDALMQMKAKEQTEKDRIARSFASSRGKKKDVPWQNAIHMNPNSSLFKIISRRYRKTLMPRLMKKKRK